METKITKSGAASPCAIQHCYLCSTEMEAVFKDTPNDTNTWFWRECDTCDEVVCANCSDDHEDGIVCVECLKEEAR